VNPNPSEPAFDELLEQLKSELPEPLFATVSKKFLAAAICRTEDPGTGRAPTAEAHSDVWSGQREADQRATGIAGVEPGVSTARCKRRVHASRCLCDQRKKRVRKHPGRQALPAELPRSSG